MEGKNSVRIGSTSQERAEKRGVVSRDGIGKKRHLLALRRRRRWMFAKKQSDLLLFPGLQRRGQSAVRTGCPLQHRRQALQHYLDNLWIIAVECYSQKIAPLIGPRFCMEIGSAHEKQSEHLEIAGHRCGHQRCKTDRIGKINRATSA